MFTPTWPDTTQLLTSNFIGPGHHAALLFSGLASTVVLFVLLFSQLIREDLARAAYCPKVTDVRLKLTLQLIMIFTLFKFYCSLHLFIERGLYFSIATHLVYMIRDAYEPFGYPGHPTQMTTNWCMSLLFMFPVLLAAELVYTKGECRKGSMENKLLTKTPVWQWTQELYLAILPLVTIGFYSNKYGEHPDYENLAKEGKHNHGFYTISRLKNYRKGKKRNRLKKEIRQAFSSRKFFFFFSGKLSNNQR